MFIDRQPRITACLARAYKSEFSREIRLNVIRSNACTELRLDPRSKLPLIRWMIVILLGRDRELRRQGILMPDSIVKHRLILVFASSTPLLEEEGYFRASPPGVEGMMCPFNFAVPHMILPHSSNIVLTILVSFRGESDAPSNIPHSILASPIRFSAYPIYFELIS